MPAPRKSRATSKAAAQTPVSVPAPAAPRVEKSEIKGSGTAISAKLDSAISPTTTPDVTYDMIAKRAYEIYASRGYAAGNPEEDWHEAERQLRAGL